MRRGNSIEKWLPWHWNVDKPVWHFPDHWLMMEHPAHCGSAIPGLVVQRCILKQAKWVMQIKQAVCRLGPLLQFLSWYVKSLNKPFPPQIAFGHNIFIRAVETLTQKLVSGSGETTLMTRLFWTVLWKERLGTLDSIECLEFTELLWEPGRKCWNRCRQLWAWFVKSHEGYQG